MNSKRIQLTLFINKDQAHEIEKIRKAFNPVQYELIKSHVTLCREDELEQIEKVIQNLEKLNQEPIALDFGPAVRFSNDKGVLIPAIGRNELFHQLRETILADIIEKPRAPEPHITLMHPRNSTCTDEIFQQIKQQNFPGKITFKKISLIEQEPGMKWEILRAIELKEKKP